MTTIETEHALMATWDRRDDRYRTARHDLSEATIEAVRLWRLRESVGLPRATMEARQWLPPTGYGR